MPIDVPPISYDEERSFPNQRLIILIVLAIIVFIVVIIYLLPKINLIFPLRTSQQPISSQITQSSPQSSSPSLQNTTTPTANLIPPASPSPTPRPLPKEPQIYTFSHGKEVQGPKPIKASINTLLPEKGQQQVFQISFAHSEPIISQELYLITDNKKTPLTLELIEGDQQTGTWQARWTMSDTYLQHYSLQYKFKDGNSIHEGELLYR